MKKCSFCQKRIGIIRQLRRKFYKATVRRLSPHGILTYDCEIYFCSRECIANYQASTGVMILN